MPHQQKPFVLALSIILVIPSASALGQVGIGGRPGIGGARPGAGGVRGLSSPRSGLGTRNNPIVNPAPSLTPNQVLNPRGSLSTGQVLNPSPSLGRPRSGGPTTGTQQTAPAAPQRGSADRLARPNSGDRTISYFDALTAELRQLKNGESLAKYLAFPKGLRSVEMTDGSSEDARKLLKRFDKLSSDPAYAKVTALPAYWLAHASLKLKLDPLPALRAAMQQALRSTDLAPKRSTDGDRILQSVMELDAGIARVAPDKGWPKRLSLNELLTAIPEPSEQPASDSVRKSLEEILEMYQAVAKNDEDAVVNQLPEFNETLAALQEYLSPLDVRQRQDLIRSFDRLGDQLREYRNGESWAKYLAPQELVSDNTEAKRDLATKLLKRFDKLSSDPTYAKVAALVAFRPAHEALKLAAEQKDTSPPPSAVAVVEKQPVAPGDTIEAADKKAIEAEDKKPTADKKPVAPVDKQPVAAPDKKAIAVADKKPIAATDSADPAPMHQSVGERILKSVVALEKQLGKVAPDKGWQKRLSLDHLEVSVSMTSDQPSSDSDRKSLAEVLETYQTIAKNKDDAVVNELPEFKDTLEALQEYLTPREAQPPKD